MSLRIWRLQPRASQGPRPAFNLLKLPPVLLSANTFIPCATMFKTTLNWRSCSWINRQYCHTYLRVQLAVVPVILHF